MDSTADYGESVLFALVDKGRVLCEIREWSGRIIESIPGGKIEQIDRESDNYQEAALIREVKEELNIEPTSFRHIGDVWHGHTFPIKWVFHAFIVEQWNGVLPEVSHEENRPLKWVDPANLIDPVHGGRMVHLLRENVS